MICLLWSKTAWQCWLSDNELFPLPLVQPISTGKGLIITTKSTLARQKVWKHQTTLIIEGPSWENLYNMNSIPGPFLQISSSTMPCSWSIFIWNYIDMSLKKGTISSRDIFPQKKGKESTFLNQEACNETFIVILPYVNRWNTPFIIPMSQECREKWLLYVPD